MVDWSPDADMESSDTQPSEDWVFYIATVHFVLTVLLYLVYID